MHLVVAALLLLISSQQCLGSSWIINMCMQLPTFAGRLLGLAGANLQTQHLLVCLQAQLHQTACDVPSTFTLFRGRNPAIDMGSRIWLPVVPEHGLQLSLHSTLIRAAWLHPYGHKVPVLTGTLSRLLFEL